MALMSKRSRRTPLVVLALVCNVLLLNSVDHGVCAATSTNLRGGGSPRILAANTTVAKQPRIIGGSKVKDNRYGYFALMLSQYVCGAVMIAPRLALSAAHCAGGSSDLRIGAQDDVDSGERIRILHAVVHPEFDGKDFDNDVVLMYLAEPSTMPYIQPGSTEISQKGTKFTVIGFGDTDSGGGFELADSLLETEVEYVDNKSCDKMHGGNDEVRDDMLCAAGKDADSCGGDSGGPLILKGNSIEEDRLVGIVSWGRGCADPDYPGVYARVSHFYDWIEEMSCKLFPADAPDYMNCAAVYGFSEAPTSAPTEPMTEAPTPSPSAAPSPAPTSAPIAVALTSQPSPAPSGPINESLLLQECSGSCTFNVDCAPGLSCFVRNNSSAVALKVPGCDEFSELFPSTNLCYNATAVSDMIDASLFKSAAVNESAPGV